MNAGGHRDDERAFGALIEGNREGLEVFCGLMLADPRQAERAMGEALLTAWRERERALAQDSTSSRIWLYRIAVRVCSEAAEVPSR